MTTQNIYKQQSETQSNNNKGGKDLVSFIHASDIHLGCQQYRNTHRSNDFIRAFQEILLMAISRKVDFIILGGDVFTSIDMLPGKLNRIIDILSNFKERSGIPIIAIEGNHDIRRYSKGMKFERGQSWLKVISNLGLIILLDVDLDATPERMFLDYNFKAKKGGKIRIKNVIIYGTRYLGEKPVDYIPKIRNAIKRDGGCFKILLQHFGIEGQMEDIPGIDLKYVLPLKDSVDYLALGHFHLQFTLNNWIFNPGSSEAACVMDSSYKRGVFYVEVLANSSFSKKVHKIRLSNRKHFWETIYFPKPCKNQEQLYSFIIKKLMNSFRYFSHDLEPSDLNMPILCLIMKGKKPMISCKIIKKEVCNLICEKFPVIDARIYEKFDDPIKKIDIYL